MYYLATDLLGSITAIVPAGNGTIEYRSYDAWGRVRNPDDWTYNNVSAFSLIDRGYTFHEHLPEFGLINMNGRMYDPLVARFLSPDPYVQDPGSTQGFNRYSYCLNNPLKYTDPSGEWNWLVAAIGTVFGYISHGATTGDWGWKAVGNGVLSGLMWGIGCPSNYGTSQALSYAGQSIVASTANSFMPSMSIPITDNFAINMSTGLGVGPNGLTAGFGLSGTAHGDAYSLTAGFGAGTNYMGWNAAATYRGYGLGYGQTSYASSNVFGQQLGAQRVGTYTGFFNHNSFSLSNDKFGDKGDRWRTSAAELTIGKWSFGTYLYTNNGETDSNNKQNPNLIPPWPVGKK